MNNFCIVVLSCSNFSDLWSNNLYLFDKYWPDHPPVFLVSDGYGKHNLRNPENLMIYKGDMSDRIIHVLEEIEFEYILLTFDDYFLNSKCDSLAVQNILFDMKDINADYCGLFKRPKIKGKREGSSGYKIIPLNKVYQVNFYPCIWKRESLLKVLEKGENIWKTEVRLTKRARENGLLCLTIGKNNIFSFTDIVRKGKYLISGKMFIKKHNLFLSNRPTRTLKETLALFAKTIGSRILPTFLKRIVKNNLRKKGHVIYSDYENTND